MRRRGARTAVVTCTWAAGTRRAGELERSLDILGAGKPRLLEYADARKPESAPGRLRFLDVPLGEAVGRLVEHIREFRPDVVLTYDAYGAYGMHAHESELERGASMTLLTGLPEQARAQMLSNEWYRCVGYTGERQTTLS
nr:PIG-L family deacetylase [Nonomuraea cypriaca]